MTDQDLALALGLDIHIHFLHEDNIKPSVLDLVWTKSSWHDHTSSRLAIEQEQRFASDHTILQLIAPLWLKQIESKTLWKDKEPLFIDDLISCIKESANHHIDTANNAEELVENLFLAICNCYDLHTSTPNIVGNF